MGKFDKLEEKADYQSMERIGDSMQQFKLPMKNDADAFNVKQELDNASPDILMNLGKKEADGKKHVLIIFYRNASGKNEWIPVVMPKYRARKYADDKNYVEVIDIRNGKRKTFKRTSIRGVRKDVDRNTHECRMYNGHADKARFK